MRKIALLTALLGLSALGAQAQDSYKVRVPLNAENEGATVYIINYDTSEKTDSTVVTDSVALFQGTMDEPYAARLMLGSSRGPKFFMEPGSIVIDQKNGPFGSPLNDLFREFNETVRGFSQQLQAAQSEEEQQAIYNQFLDLQDSVMRENADNPIGYVLLLESAYNMEPAELKAYVAKNPTLQNSARIKKLIEMNDLKAATSEGQKYKDFDINGQKLSDYVGKDGKYLLVDFWASWCGPCRREIPVIKEIWEANKDKLNVLGVAVWDEPTDTEAAIKQLGIQWPVIINAQTVPTDLYGISGIPCIILISPDGTILSRDKQDEALKADIDKYLK